MRRLESNMKSAHKTRRKKGLVYTLGLGVHTGPLSRRVLCADCFLYARPNRQRGRIAHRRHTQADRAQAVSRCCSPLGKHSPFSPKIAYNAQSNNPLKKFSGERRMKTYHVVAAIIKKGDKIFATQRGYGDYKDGWEFPGGKIEPGETPEQALVREITEELGMTIAIDRHVVSISYDYPEFHLEMGSYLCSIAEGTPRLLEHEAAKWLRASEIDSVNWLPADVLVVDALKEQGIA